MLGASPLLSWLLGDELMGRAGSDGILQRAGRGIYPGQFRYYLRTTGRDDGLWVPADYREQDIARVSQDTYPA